MSALVPLAVNALWLLASFPAAIAYRCSRRRVAAVQERALLRIVRQNRESAFGRRHAFARIRTAVEFRSSVPLSVYDDCAGAIAAIGGGERKVLTAEAVRLLEPTGGSGGGAKLIPYTNSLQAEFSRGIAPWITDLFLRMPALMAGEAYWSVTPAGRRESTVGGIPVGFADDSDYLGIFGRLLAGVVQAVPPVVREIDDMEAFWYATLLFLLRCRRLSLISVWNPTFLTLLADRLAAGHERLAADLAGGRFAPPAEVPPGAAAELARRLRPDPRRGEEIGRAFAAGGSRGEIHARLWPNLRLISCWTEGHAAAYATEVAALFPHARLQGKGLIATEGIVSFPRLGGDGGCLAVRSHFFEFLPAEGGEPRLAHQLEAGRIYSVVLTTGGGLYRYRLHDLVEVAGHEGDCPRLRFCGREGGVADRFGEKLHEDHVHRALAAAAERCGIVPRFTLVAFEEAPSPAYALFIEAPASADELLLRVGEELDRRLGENFHYRYCRDLGQLAAARVFRIERGGREAFLDRCREVGQRLGDIKPVALHRESGWSRVFPGRFLPSGSGRTATGGGGR